MPDRMDPRVGYDRSSFQLGRSMLNNPLRDFLRDLATRDRVTVFNDFKDIGEINNWTVAQTQTSVNFTSVADQVGVLQATVVATTTASVSMVSKQAWGGNSNCMIEGRFKIDTVASTFAIEFGWVDGAPATGASFVTGFTTPSFAGTNGAVFAFDNSQAHTSIAFGSVGAFTSQTTQVTLITAATAGFTTPAAATYITAKVLLLTNSGETGKARAYLWVNGILRGRHEPAAGAINGQANLFGWLYFKSVAAAAKIPVVDYLRLSQDRFALGAASE